MLKRVILLSGAVSSGKSTLSDGLRKRFKMDLLKTKEIIRQRFPASESERGTLQKLGEQLDRKTSGGWVRDEVTRYLEENPKAELLLIDAVRIEEQVEAIRKAFGPKVFHIHLDAPDDVLSIRYRDRKQPDVKEFGSYSQVVKNRTEQRINRLRGVADAVIQTNRCTPDDVLVIAASNLGLYGRQHEELVDVVIGGEYGSEGKGHIVSYLAREYDWLVRVGGPNAGHKVFQDPTPYTHHQLPSGTLFSAAKLIIAPGSVLNTRTLLKEINDCRVDNSRLFIDPQAMVIDSQDIKREAKLVESIGSTGQGVGAATARRIMGRSDAKLKLARDINDLRPYVKPTGELLERAYSSGRRILLEGTQGTGLSLYHGSYPHVTSRDTTVAGCLSEAGIPPSRVRKIVMVCRSYPIRVESPANASSGFMSREISWAEIGRRSGIDPNELESLEKTSTTHKRRRVGEFDWALLRKSSSINGPTDIALTFADYVSGKNTEARRFEQLTPETIRFTEEIEKVSGAPVSLISTRFHWRSIIDRRSW
jgi:adenylosuccinate synthase